MLDDNPNILERLTDNQKNIIVSLPYRVGLWVSVSDMSGGQEANARELEALHNILHGFAEQVFGAEEIQYIISETLRQKEQWPVWDKQIRTVLKDCQDALDILSSHMDEKGLEAFRSYLIEIGEAVALSFREREEPGSSLSKLKAYLGFKLDQMRSTRARVKAMGFEEYLNISPAERKALDELAGALGTQYS